MVYDWTIFYASAFNQIDHPNLSFACHRCPPCRAFTPKLIDFYNTSCNNNNHDLEVIFISSDRDEESFSTYFGKMPWLASVPAFSGMDANERQRKLADMFKIQGIPSLIILDAKTGNFITDDARNQVIQATTDEAKLALLESWKAAEAVPIEQAVFASGGSNSWLGSIFLFFARNPVFMIGMFYFVKRSLRYLEELGKTDEGIEGGKSEL
ncbi:hypothetical protein HJC23_009200 [Cyclotella cryptica]|uniref:Thioredoxin-like fold domain-containing protein n=1 Tax=Cyclotella cryptica TaxID=29204 RepID=A0ABD3NR11_9STRA